jgi:hypothetical protein
VVGCAGIDTFQGFEQKVHTGDTLIEAAMLRPMLLVHWRSVGANILCSTSPFCFRMFIPYRNLVFAPVFVRLAIGHNGAFE